jgi:hypothetical protein
VNAPIVQGRAGRWIAIVASLVVVATIVAAIAVMGSPSKQRLMRLDERRVDELGNIANQIESWRNEHGRLPGSLAELAAAPGVRVAQDPASGRPYGYEVLGASEYRLCAQFDTDTAIEVDSQPWRGAVWAHGIGRQCFTRRAGGVRE